MSEKKRKARILDAPKDRYADLPEIPEDEVYLPPRVDLASMTKEQIATHSMRHFGVRPDERLTKDQQADEVERRMRAGRPIFA